MQHLWQQELSELLMVCMTATKIAGKWWQQQFPTLSKWWQQLQQQTGEKMTRNQLATTASNSSRAHASDAEAMAKVMWAVRQFQQQLMSKCKETNNNESNKQQLTSCKGFGAITMTNANTGKTITLGTPSELEQSQLDLEWSGLFMHSFTLLHMMWPWLVKSHCAISNIAHPWCTLSLSINHIIHFMLTVADVHVMNPTTPIQSFLCAIMFMFLL